MDCGWTTTSMASKPIPKSACASITSRPLFMSVEESMVIFGPMLQVGCASASSTPTSASSSVVAVRNGPPEAVKRTRRTDPAPPPTTLRHWWIAQCSESTGMISAPGVDRTCSTSGAAAIRDSLLASASRRPARSAPSVAGRPAKPSTALTVTSAAPAAVSRPVAPMLTSDRSTPASTSSWAARSLATTTCVGR